MPNVTFVCFSTNNLKRERDQIMEDARMLGIFSSIQGWDEESLHVQPEYHSLPDRLKSGRGHGFFWWKPFIIRKALQSVDKDGLVFYSDCGRYDGGFRLGKELTWLLDRYSETGFVGVEVPQFGSSARWTKMDCFLGLSRDVSVDLERPQLLAAFSLWRNIGQTRQFVSLWEAACRDPALVSDDPSLAANDPRFLEHRHDQSILTILAHQYSMSYLKPFARWESAISRPWSNTYEGNVSIKKVAFVVRCLRCRCAIPLLALSYLRRKLATFAF